MIINYWLVFGIVFLILFYCDIKYLMVFKNVKMVYNIYYLVVNNSYLVGGYSIILY